MNHILFQPPLYDIGIPDAIAMHNDYEAGYIHSCWDIPISIDLIDFHLEQIEKVCGELKKYNYTRSKNEVLNIYQNDIIKLYIGGSSNDLACTILSTDQDLCHALWNLLKVEVEEESEDEMFAHTYYMDGGDLEVSVKRMEYRDLKYLSPSYYPYINLNVMFDQFFTGQENIMLVVGQPGLGKSKLSSIALKYAFENIDKIPYDKVKKNDSLENQYVSIAFVKSIEVLAHDKFWRTLDKNNHDFVIIDDLDYMLTKREAEINTSEDMTKNVFLNQFLSFTDGVERRKTKFIITTNQRYDEIDTALLRKGRLFDILELRKLNKKEALVIWEEAGLQKREFNKLYKECEELLPADLGSEISKRTNKKIENKLDNYLLEEGISKVKKAGRSRKIGL